MKSKSRLVWWQFAAW